MSWICPNCNCNNTNINELCANYNCRTVRPTPRTLDEFDELLREVRLHESRCATQSNSSPAWNVLSTEVAFFIRDYENGKTYMTPEEQLFADLFQKHINILHPYVKDMDLLEIRAYREKLSLIAKEAKAGVYAADQAEKEVIKKRGSADDKPTGFQRSLNTDETTTKAINTIKDRQKRMSKTEKIQAGLEKLGISMADAAKLMSAGTILGRIKQKASELDGVKTVVEESTPVFNPFAKKEG